MGLYSDHTVTWVEQGIRFDCDQQTLEMASDTLQVVTQNLNLSKIIPGAY